MPGVLIPDWEPDETGRNVPAKITVEDFRRYFSASFPKLMAEEHDGLIQDAIDTVYAVFTGVNTIWDIHPNKVWHEKSQVCYRLLTAWYIGDTAPWAVAGVSVMGGILLKRKKIDGVDLTFADTASNGNKNYEDLLESLNSNPWGRKARLMIKAAGKRTMLRNRRIT
jgi:hypothetical protein